MSLEITDQNFDEIIKSDKPVLIDFWTEWCAPCKMLNPVIEELSKEFEGKAIIGKVNADINPSIVSRFGIRNVPTLLYFKRGQMVDKHNSLPKTMIAEKLNSLLG